MKQYAIGKRFASVIAAAILLLFMAGIGNAKAVKSKDVRKLNTEITMLDKDATVPNGEKVITDRLSKEFNLSADQIKTLRDKKMGYGEIATVYAFADKLPGGVTEDNLKKVMSLREGKKGWGDIAKSLDVDLGSVASKVGGIEKDAHKDIKKASTEGAAGSAGGGGRYGGKKGGGGY